MVAVLAGGAVAPAGRAGRANRPEQSALPRTGATRAQAAVGRCSPDRARRDPLERACQGESGDRRAEQNCRTMDCLRRAAEHGQFAVVGVGPSLTTVGRWIARAK